MDGQQIVTKPKTKIKRKTTNIKSKTKLTSNAASKNKKIKKNKSKKPRRQLVKFSFPEKRQDYQKFLSSTQLEQKLNKQRMTNFDFNTSVHFDLFNGNISKYYAQCQECDAKLSYVKCREMGQLCYKLVVFRNQHRHEKKMVKKKRKKIQIAEKLHEMAQCGLTPNHQFITSKFQCGISTFYSAKRLVDGVSKKQTLKSMLQNLKQQKYSIKVQPSQKDLNQDQFPTILVLMSREMKKNYQRYGRCVYLDSTYNLCKNRPNFQIDKEIQLFNSKHQNQLKKRSRQFALTTICGLNGFRKIVPFGFAITLDQSSTSTFTILKTFFEWHQKIHTQTIITDGAIGIARGIAMLNEQNILKCTHLTDSYHFLANLKIKGTEKRKLLSQIYKAQTECQFKEHIAKLKSISYASEFIEVQKLQQKCHLFCFCKVPKIFMHCGSSNSPCEKLNDIIKSKIKFSESYPVLLQKLCQVFDKVCVKSTRVEMHDRQQLYNLQELEKCRKYLCKKIMKKILHQYWRSFYNRVTPIANPIDPLSPFLPPPPTAISTYTYTYNVTNTKYQQNLTLTLQPSNKLKCNCGYQQKTLLPCSHVISVLALLGGDIYDQVDGFYKQEIEVFEELHQLAKSKSQSQRKSKSKCMIGRLKKDDL